MSPSTWFRVVGLCGLIIVLGVFVPGWSEEAKGKKYALLVGVNEYKSGKLASLKYAENDVEKLAAILRDKTKGGFDDVRLLSGKAGKSDSKDAPTAKNVREALQVLIKGKGKDDVVLIALSGHGLQLEVDDPDGKGKPKTYSYFCPSDADLADTVSYSTGRCDSLIHVKEVFAALDKCGAGGRLVLMDCCRNEFKAESASRGLDLESLAIPKGVGALFSCDAGQKAYETADLEHGVFFHFVLKGLSGEAANKNKEVTWAKLVDYVTEEVTDDVPRRIGGGARQHPHALNNLSGKSPVLAVIGKEPKVVKDDKNTFTNSIDMKLVRVKAGTFTMGSPKDEKDRGSEEEQHEVKLTLKDYFIGVTEVTQGQFRAVMGFNPSFFSHDGKASDKDTYDGSSKPGGGKDKVKDFSQKDLDQFPVENVSWEDAQEFLKKLNGLDAEEKSKVKYRLATEAEWEYACRGGPVFKDNKAKAQLPFHFKSPTASLSSDKANFDGDYPYGGADKGKYLQRTCKVGSYEENALGLVDVHGNVWEWCSDWYDKDYYGKSAALKDPLGPESGSGRVGRGGGWNDYGRNCRAALRYGGTPSGRYRNLGFRVAAVPHE